MKKVRYIGLDMDHTLVRYKTKHFESIVYRYVLDKLVTDKHYPKEIKNLTFHFDEAIRGLVIDSKHGNVLKLSRYSAIRQSKHGTKIIPYQEQKALYRSRYVDLYDPNYMVIDTSFSIAFCALYAQLVDLHDANPKQFPSYDTIAQDLFYTVNEVHTDNEIKQQVTASFDEFILTDPELVASIERYIHFGKKFFIVTNSSHHYTQQLLDYAITPFVSNGKSWQDLFEYVITLANKPRFFFDNLPFLHISDTAGALNNVDGHLAPGIYQAGNAASLTESLGCNDDEILYIGDHIYGDILRLKKACNWHTALVVEELGEEILAQKKALPLERKITRMMTLKKELEHTLIEARTQSNASQTTYTSNTSDDVQAKLTQVDEKIATYLQEQQRFYNPNWGRVFRAGAEESYFAYQVERYACLYMEKLVDLLEYSPLTYFRPYHRMLPHDIPL